MTSFAADFRDARILEIGSGQSVDGAYPYSFADVFHPSCQVLRSDLNPEFGHPVVDITNHSFDSEFDVIVCTSVLEHVWDLHAAVVGMRRALKDDGTAFIGIPMFYPLHDEPHDYWRITEHGIRMLFDGWDVDIHHRGVRLAPLAYYLTAKPISIF